MKLHLPKLLRKALLACMLVSMTVGYTVASGASTTYDLLAEDNASNWNMLSGRPNRGTPAYSDGAINMANNWAQQVATYALTEGVGMTDDKLSFTMEMRVKGTASLTAVSLVGENQTLVLGSAFYGTNTTANPIPAGAVGFGVSDNARADGESLAQIHTLPGANWSGDNGSITAAGCTFTQFTMGESGVVYTNDQPFTISGCITLSGEKYLLDLYYNNNLVVDDYELADGFSSIYRVAYYYDGADGANPATLYKMTLTSGDLVLPHIPVDLTWNADAENNVWTGNSWLAAEAESASWGEGDNAIFTGTGESVRIESGTSVIVGNASVVGTGWIWDNEGSLSIKKKLTVGDGTTATSLAITGATTVGSAQVENAASLKISGATTVTAAQVKAGATLEIAPGSVKNLSDIVASLSAADNSIIKFSGSGTEVTFTGNVLNSADIVVDGAKLAFSAGNNVYLGGNLTLQNGAEVTASAEGDAFNWNSAQNISILNSELKLSGHRISVQGSDVITLNNGKITGTGDAQGSLDFFDNGGVLTSNGTSVISAPIKFRDSNETTTFKVESGTLTIGQMMDTGNGTLKKTGVGTLILTSSAEGQKVSTLKGGLNHVEGRVHVAGVVNILGASTFTEGTTLAIKNGGNLNLGGTSTWSGDVTVESGGVLTLNSVHTVAGSLTVDNGGSIKLGTSLAPEEGATLTKPADGVNGWTMTEVVFLQSTGSVTGFDKVTNSSGSVVDFTTEVVDGVTTYKAQSAAGDYYVQNTAEKVEYSEASGLTGANNIYMSDGTTLVVKAGMDVGRVTVAEGESVNFEVEGVQLNVTDGSKNVEIKSLSLANGATLRSSSGKEVLVTNGTTIEGDNTINANSCQLFDLKGETSIKEGGSLRVHNFWASAINIEALTGAGTLILDTPYGPDNGYGASYGNLRLRATVGISDAYTGLIEARNQNGDYTFNIAEGSTFSADRLSNNGNKSDIKLTGSGTYDIGANMAFQKNEQFVEGWAGTIKVVGASVTSSMDTSALVTEASGLEIAGVTVAEGAELTLTGAVTLSGTIASTTTIINNATLTLGSDLMFDLSGLTPVEETEEGKKYQVLTSGDLSSLNSRIDDALDANFVAAAGSGTWEFGTDGTLTFTAGVAENIFLVKGTVAYDSATVTDLMDTIQMDGGELQIGDTALDEDLTQLVVNAKDGSIIGTGSVTEVSFDAITVSAGGTLTIKDGTTDLTLKTGDLTLNSGSQIVVEAGQTLDVRDFDYAGTNTIEGLGKISDSGLFNQLVNATSGAGVLMVKAEGAMGIKDNIEVNTNLVMDKLTINGWQSAGDSKYVLTVHQDASLQLAGNLGVETRTEVKVDGGELQAKVINLGHSNGGAPGELSMTATEGSSIKVEGIALTKTGDTGNKFTMAGGTLEITTAAGIAAGVETEITGGELVANSASWGITGGTIGGVTVQTTGDNSITLTDAQLTSTITNTSGKLVLSGTIDIKSEGYQTQAEVAAFSNGNNGYATSDYYYQLATDAAQLTTADGVTFTLDSASNTNLALVTDSESAYYKWLKLTGTEFDNIYRVNEGTVTYSNTDTTFKTGTTQILVNGGTLELETSLSDDLAQYAVNSNGPKKPIRIAAGLVGEGENAEPGATVVIGGNAVLKHTQMGVLHGVYLSGSGVYDIGNTSSLQSGARLADTWTGTVKMTDAKNITGLNIDALSMNGSKVSLQGVTAYLLSTDTDNDRTYKAALELTDTTDSKALTLNQGSADGVSIFSGAVSGNGSFVVGSGTPSGSSYKFTGDLGQWNGSFEQNNSGTSNLEIASTGEVKTNLVRTDGTLNITISGANVTMSGNITGENATSTAYTTLTVENGANVEITGSVLVSKLTNKGVLNLVNDLSLNTLNNTGTLTATDKNITLSELASGGAGKITAATLTLQGAGTNALGDLELGSLTLGTADAVSKLTAGVLNVGALTLNNFDSAVVGQTYASIITAGSLVSSMEISIDDALLAAKLGTAAEKTITLLELTNQYDENLAVTLAGAGDDGILLSSDGSIQYKLEWDANGKVLNLTAALLGSGWVGETDGDNGTVDLAEWHEGSSWEGGTAPGTGSMVKLTGSNEPTIFLNGSEENVAKQLTVDTKMTYWLCSTDTAQTGKLTLGEKLAINNGTLNLDGVEVQTKSDTSDTTLANVASMLQMMNGAKLDVGGNLNNSGTVYSDAASTVEVAGNVTNDSSITTNGTFTVGGAMTNNSNFIVGGGQVAIGAENAAAGTTSLTNNGMVQVTNGTATVNGAMVNGDLLEVTGGSVTVNGNVDNDGGIITVSGGSVAINGTVTNDTVDSDKGRIEVTGGSLTIGAATTQAGTTSLDNTGGELIISGGLADDGKTPLASVTVNGDLDNTSGTIIIGSAAMADGDPDTEGDQPVDATVGSLKVTGNLTGTGSKDALVVEEGSSLSVGGKLEASQVELDFNGTVEVTGDATIGTLTNDGSFTATNIEVDTVTNNGTITAANATIGALTNNGALNVGTKADDGTLTGGNLSIDSLTGSGDVTVGEGGTLTIESQTNFTGTLSGGGKVTTGTEAFVLTTQQDAATDLDASMVTLTSGTDADGNATSGNGSVLGDVTTDGITIDTLDKTLGGAHLTVDSLTSQTAGGPITITLTQMQSAEGAQTLVDAGEHTYTLVSVTGGTATFGLGDIADDAAQVLWKAGLKLSELQEPVTTFALRSAITAGGVTISVETQGVEDATWDSDGETTHIGADLGTLSNGTMVLESNAVLDKVQSVNMVQDMTLDLSSNDTAAVNINGLQGAANLSIVGNGDTVNIAANLVDAQNQPVGYEGTLSLENVTAKVTGVLNEVSLGTGTTADVSGSVAEVNIGTGAAASVNVTDAKVVLAGGELSGASSMKGGELNITTTVEKMISGTNAIATGTKLTVDGTDIVLVADAPTGMTMNVSGENGQTLASLGNLEGKAGEVSIVDANNNSIALLDKYFSNVRVEGNAVVADRNTSYYSDKLADGASSDNGKAGLTLADAALANENAQADPDSVLGDVLDALDTMVATGNTGAADELGAALAGASTAVLGMAVSNDVERQLKAIRNRTTTMGVDQGVVNPEMPYYNAWINAEGGNNELRESGTKGGYKLSSWGGTVGFDVDIAPTFTAGMALTAMYGDLTVKGADQAKGDLDTYYVSAFARYCASAWTHTFVATAGLADMTLNRTVYGEELEGDTTGLSFGMMYEVGRVYALNEDATACLQPIFNVTWRHTQVDGYAEKGSELALDVDQQTYDTLTFGVGARLQAVVGETMYNRTCIFECRALVKADVGDTQGSSEVSLAGATAEVESAELGAIGLEAGAGITIPLGDEGSSIFADASIEVRSGYTNANGTVGYRVNF